MNAADIAATLKQVRPHKLRVVLNDNTERNVAMMRGRNRWSGTAQIVDGMQWTEILCLDGTGAVCAAPLRREDAPAADLESMPGPNPSQAQLGALTTHLAALVREVHRTATTAATEMITKLRRESREEVADLVKGYEALARMAINRGTGFEERANDLQAENDELREALATSHGERVARAASNEDPESRRERVLIEAIGGLVGGKKEAPAAVSDEGKNGKPES